MSGIINRIRYHLSFNKIYALYGIIDKTPGLNIIELSEIMKKSKRKIRFYVNSLLNDGLIKEIIKKINDTEVITYHSKNWKELINWDEIKHMKRPEGF